MTRGGSTPTRGPAPSFAPVQSDSGGAGPAIDGWPGTEGPYTAAFDDPESFRVVPQTSEGKIQSAAPHPTDWRIFATCTENIISDDGREQK